MTARVTCACGRLVGERVFRQHGRRCTAQLIAWADAGRHPDAVGLLDERSARRRPEGCTCLAQRAARDPDRPGPDPCAACRRVAPPPRPR